MLYTKKCLATCLYKTLDNSANVCHNSTMMNRKDLFTALDMICASLMIAASILVPFALYFYGVIGTWN
jgi:hypothetical protein